MFDLAKLYHQALEEGKSIRITLRKDSIEAELCEDLEEMSLAELENYLSSLLDQQENLEDREPEDDESEDHEKWLEAYEDLEDLIDDVRTHIDDFN